MKITEFTYYNSEGALGERYINPMHIVEIHAYDPDVRIGTIITLSTGKELIVKGTFSDIRKQVNLALKE
jgi:uncharacterized protein YlzI (FlbEa/FlbD family)